MTQENRVDYNKLDLLSKPCAIVKNLVKTRDYRDWISNKILTRVKNSVERSKLRIWELKFLTWESFKM